MSSSEQVPNPGARAVDENLAGTRDEFNDEVTKVLLEDAQEDKSPGDEERDSQPALEEDEQTVAKPDNS
ncbi:hypothetical protein LJ753_10605 [Arthrobacter sp. zg-Y20]|uniref:hypothetical protein n=1 Tax=unclassified Arthrobacter TaxID=235627 RepID=UPI001D13BBB8|nr:MULTISPECIES: hypothetical protein [unclassified Arthrobacter]MCC3276321.1 hypothetical protein [Arthrobacter sp. zg-Y20]MDK1316480.1 hypothetical protein [Arthrobacter sp. zg.Y20]WIB06523.1 hypothetical protein QNO06_01910 [Arthrobacter sp. zg-Y20]